MTPTWSPTRRAGAMFTVACCVAAAGIILTAHAVALVIVAGIGA